MAESTFTPGTAVVVGASGQDGYYLTARLLEEGRTVHATARRVAALAPLAARGRLHAHEIELRDPAALVSLIGRVRPEEVYNLAGQSSVSRSFADPLQTWRTNADFVAELLECVRLRSPRTRLYQASSTDMFGGGGAAPYNEESALRPRSPYASAKAAAHMLCRSYREAYGLRIACGILSNHESARRPAHFLTRHIADHVRALAGLAPVARRAREPLRMGNLKVRRDWGFAPDFVEGMRLILRQIEVRARRRAGTPEEDSSTNYRDYVLCTGRTHAVWELTDAAFRLAGFQLDWSLEGDDPARWQASFRATGRPAVVVDPSLVRRADPPAIELEDARARRDLGWEPRRGLEVFLKDMLGEAAARDARESPRAGAGK